MKNFLLVFMLVPAIYAMRSSFDDGKNTAESMKNGIEDDIKSGIVATQLSSESSFATCRDRDTPAGGEKIGTGVTSAFEHLRHNEYGEDLVEIHKTRKPYILDGTEPFMVRSENIHKNPEKAFVEAEEIEEGNDFTIETCEECPYEEYLVKARKTKKRHVYLDKPPYIEVSGAHCNHGYLSVHMTTPNEPDDAFLEDGTFNIVHVGRTVKGADTYEHFLVNGVPVDLKKTVLQNGAPRPNRGNECVVTRLLHAFVLDSPDLIKTLLGGSEDQTYNWGRIGTAHLYHRVVNDTGKHYWILDDACQHYEQLVEQGLCRYHSMVEDPPADKYRKGKKVNGSWGQTATYACRAACKDTCQKLRARGCSRLPNPECLEKAGGKCIRWRWKFKCRDRIGMKKHRFAKQDPFCLGGDCIDSSFESDKDLIQALGYLSILEEARKELDGTANISVFKGSPYSCTRFPLSFKDCCGCKGWGINIGLAGCDEDSKTVAKLRENGKCIQIGTHCAEYVNVGLTKFCLRKKTVFCCFGSKFAKLLQEQGKPQLGLNFGTSQEPNCRGFTPEELSRIDFSKLDLTEITNDIMDKFKPQTEEHFAKGGELDRIRQQMQDKMQNTGNTEAGYLKENMKHLVGSLKSGGK